MQLNYSFNVNVNFSYMKLQGEQKLYIKEEKEEFQENQEKDEEMPELEEDPEE